MNAGFATPLLLDGELVYISLLEDPQPIPRGGMVQIIDWPEV
ncbi:hypothetical protein [Sinomonas sp.]|nr:hypothetical protein [Sinomonas sp.]